MVALAVMLTRRLPSYREYAALRYPRLLLSVLAIARRVSVLRRRAVYGALAFADFCVLWTTLAFPARRPHYHYGEAVIGPFGLAEPPGAGGIADRTPQRQGMTVYLTGLMSVLLSLSFLLIWLTHVAGLSSSPEWSSSTWQAKTCTSPIRVIYRVAPGRSAAA